MNKQAREIWGSSLGGSLMRTFMGMQKMTEEDKQALRKLKEVDPPKIGEQQSMTKKT